MLTFETLIVGGGGGFLGLNLQLEIWYQCEGVFGESDSKILVEMQNKVEIPNPLRHYDGGLAHIWSLVLHVLGDSSVARERKSNGFRVVELLLRPDCLGRSETAFGCGWW
jgi:hypothetical protein